MALTHSSVPKIRAFIEPHKEVIEKAKQGDQRSGNTRPQVPHRDSCDDGKLRDGGKPQGKLERRHGTIQCRAERICKGWSRSPDDLEHF